MSNKKSKRVQRAELKSQKLRSGRVADTSLIDINDTNMTEAQRDSNEKDVLAGIDAQAARNIVIVNEEFAKLAVPITPEVTAVQVAILARFAKRDATFHANVVTEFSEVDLPEEDLTGNLDL